MEEKIDYDHKAFKDGTIGWKGIGYRFQKKEGEIECPKTKDWVDKPYCQSFLKGKGCINLSICWNIDI